MGIALAGTLILSGCSDASDVGMEKPEEGQPANVCISISSRSLGLATRADGDPLDPATDYEKINDWWMVFVDARSNVAKILTRSEATATNAAVEQETLRCIIPTGTYDIYAFANITPAELTAASGLTFSERQSAPTDVMSAVWRGLNGSDGRVAAQSVTLLGTAYDANVGSVTNDNLNLWNASMADGKPIPMTGCLRSVRIENTIEEKFSIEVVRMVAKVELRFLNPGDRDVTINEVAISPVTTSGVSLFPDYNAIGARAFSPLGGAEYARLKHSISPSGLLVGKAVDDGGVTVAGENAYVFYIKESLSASAGSFTVWLDVTYEDGVSEFLQCTPTSDITDYINRNDWIRIPISLSDYDVKVEAVFYPPIGGYPAISEGVDPDGSQQFTFGTQGKFGIMPYVTDKTKGTPVAYRNYRIEVAEIRYSAKTETGNWERPDWEMASLIYSSDPLVVTASDKGIFSQLPTKVEESSTALPYEILGELNTDQGIARVTLKVSVYEDANAEGASPKHTYTRTLYIIRKNPSTNNQN